MNNPSLASLWPLIPLFFVAIWLIVSFLVSLSGWRTLAAHFRADSRPQGQSFILQSAVIGGGEYQGCLHMILAPDGLWMRPILPFRAFHAPLFLPWSAFETPKLEKRFWLRQWSTEVRTGSKTPGQNRVKMWLSPSVGEIIAARVAALPPTGAATPTSAVDSGDSPWS